MSTSAPSPSTAPPEAPAERRISIKVDGIEHVLFPDLVTGSLARRVRDAAGMSFRKVMQTMGEDPDLDTVAVAVWVATIQAGKEIPLAEIEASLSYGSDLDVDQGGGEVDEDHPSS